MYISKNVKPKINPKTKAACKRHFHILYSHPKETAYFFHHTEQQLFILKVKLEQQCLYMRLPGSPVKMCVVVVVVVDSIFIFK